MSEEIALLIAGEEGYAPVAELQPVRCFHLRTVQYDLCSFGSPFGDGEDEPGVALFHDLQRIAVDGYGGGLAGETVKVEEPACDDSVGAGCGKLVFKSVHHELGEKNRKGVGHLALFGLYGNRVGQLRRSLGGDGHVYSSADRIDLLQVDIYVIEEDGLHLCQVVALDGKPLSHLSLCDGGFELVGGSYLLNLRRTVGREVVAIRVIDYVLLAGGQQQHQYCQCRIGYLIDNLHVCHNFFFMRTELTIPCCFL